MMDSRRLPGERRGDAGDRSAQKGRLLGDLPATASGQTEQQLPFETLRGERGDVHDPRREENPAVRAAYSVGRTLPRKAEEEDNRHDRAEHDERDDDTPSPGPDHGSATSSDKSSWTKRNEHPASPASEMTLGSASAWLRSPSGSWPSPSCSSTMAPGRTPTRKRRLTSSLPGRSESQTSNVLPGAITMSRDSSGGGACSSPRARMCSFGTRSATNRSWAEGSRLAANNTAT